MPPSLIEDFVKGFEHLDWDLAIRRNRDQLRQIVLALFALAGCLTSPRRGPQAGETRGSPWSVPGLAGRRGVFPLLLPRSTIAAIMMILRPAESALRRLIVIVASSIKISGLAARSGGWLISPLAGEMSRSDRGGRAGRKSFPLFDPLKSFDPDSLWDADPTYQSSYTLAKSIACPDASTDHTPTDATHIAHRLNAILRALNDLPRQARRLKRWELKRDTQLRSLMLRCERSEPRSTQPWRPTRFSPMRPGLPPGWRERKVYEIDHVLKECHRLANDRLESG